MIQPLFDLTSEPWCWHPEKIAKLTDYQIEVICAEQSKRVLQHTKEEPKLPQTETDMPANAPTPDVPFARSGAQWDYAISSGMTPDQAEQLLRSRGG